LRETAIERAIMLGQHIIETKNTVRKTASLFGVSKSTVHKDVTQWNGGSRLREPPF
jgi:putative DeoR family transcriptional regulator (stage III sporulation protein D)